MATVNGFSNLGFYQAGYMPEVKERHNPMNPAQAVVRGDSKEIDGTPAWAAGIGVLALLVLVGLDRAGFRFAFGVRVGK